jgi:exodeoxyribonuclease VII small subunit
MVRCDRSLWCRAMAKTQGIEDHFKAIEEAVKALEAGELTLEQSLSRYETGLKAVRQARGLLDQYTARLEVLRAEPPKAP